MTLTLAGEFFTAELSEMLSSFFLRNMFLLGVNSTVGEGNGNPLQCSCLENPRDGGTWWAALYGVAQSDMAEAT